MLKTRRVLIAGGAGFIGSNLCKMLLREGAWVDCVDNLITGQIDSISSLRSISRFRFLKMDITDAEFAQTALSTRYEEIYHLACPTGVPNIEPLGEEMIRTCSIGTENILRAACAHNARVIYASSAEVYGDPEEYPQRETYSGNVDPVGPRSAYEEGKRFGESLTRLYALKYDVDAKIVRIFNTFGVGMRLDDTRVIPCFLQKLRERKRFTVYGDGTQTRTHLYVEDLMRGLHTINAHGTKGEVYNLGGEQQLSILQLIDILRDLVDIPIDVEHQPHFIDDHAGRRPMVDKAKALGWSPRVSIRAGLRRMLKSQNIEPLAPRAPSTPPPKSTQIPPTVNVAGKA